MYPDPSDRVSWGREIGLSGPFVKINITQCFVIRNILLLYLKFSSIYTSGQLDVRVKKAVILFIERLIFKKKLS